MGYMISWHPVDLHPVSYIVQRNSVPVKSGAWNSSSETISISVDGLPVGTYSYTITVTDVAERKKDDGGGCTPTDGNGNMFISIFAIISILMIMRQSINIKQ